MNTNKFFQKINNNTKNIRFSEIVTFLESLGFTSRCSGGSHMVFSKPGITEKFNIQEDNGEAKSYQIKQIIKIIEKYNLL